jgi:spermidine synthase
MHRLGLWLAALANRLSLPRTLQNRSATLRPPRPAAGPPAAEPEAPPPALRACIGRHLIPLVVGSLGVSATIVQLVLMRELLSSFYGNELIIGTILADWLFLTGLGCWLARISRDRPQRSALSPKPAFEPTAVAPQSMPQLHPKAVVWLGLGQILIALLPLVQVLLLRTARDALFTRGADISYSATALSSALLLAPFCLLSGFMLAWAAGLPTPATTSSQPSTAIPESGLGRAYLADTIGSLAGGLVFSFVLIHWLDHLALLAVPALLNLLVALLAACSWRPRGSNPGQTPCAVGIAPQALRCHQAALSWVGILAAASALGLVALFVFAAPDRWTTARQFPHQTVRFHGNSPYGRLVVTEQDGQINFIENGLPVLSSHQTEWAEEAAHYGLAQRPTPRRVLVLGGTFAGVTAEVLKYSPEEVVCVEFDPLVAQLATRFLPMTAPDPRVRTVVADGRSFLKHTTDRFDAVLVNVPAPSTALLNRFYTVECLREAKHVLNTNGVLCFGFGHYENVVSRELQLLLSCACHTATRVFRNVLMLPGERVFFLASDGPLYPDIAQRLEAHRIPTRFVNRHYLDAALTPERLADLRHAVGSATPVNADFEPVLYLYHLRHWLSQFDSQPWLLVIPGALLLLLYAGRLPASGFTVFASGFTASAVEVVLLLAMQALCGSLYQQVGLVVATVMAGLALGACLAVRGPARRTTASPPATTGPPPPPPAQPAAASRTARRQLTALALALCGLSACLPLILRVLGSWAAPAPTLFVQAAILLLGFLVALPVGMQIPIAGRLPVPNLPAGPARLFTADLIGAGLGALLASAWLIPAFGLGRTCVIAALLNLLAGARLLLRRAR